MPVGRCRCVCQDWAVDRRRVLTPLCAIAASALISCGERVVSTGASNDEATLATTVLETMATTSLTDTTTTQSPTTSPITLRIDVTTTSALPLAGSADDTLPPPVPATEHQLAVLAAAFSMPGRPELHDVPFGHEVSVGSRVLVVNVPIFGAWQYNDLDAQRAPGATPAASEAAARDLLSELGIDTTGLTATFTPNGPGTDVDLGGCKARFTDDGRIVFAYGLLEDIA